uniref:Ubiquitin-like domain-containing protein n=1 Tax=Acrobeloides nanus TaxID=290746 RepID=A0A914CWZ4_9BILA
MKLAIDLQDHEGISHDKIVWTLDDKATVDQLMDKIESVFKIDKDRQRLFFKGSQLLFGTLQKAGIENEDTVVLVT